MNAIRLVFLKETVDNLRDKRAVYGTLLFGSLIGPLTFALMFNLVISKEVEKAEQVLELPITGQEYAPTLVDFLRQQGVVVEPGPDNPEQLVEEKTEDLILRIPADYPVNL